jgi:DNA-binding IclR family transcriptional regulator
MSIKVLDKACLVLEKFTSAQPEWTASEMARELELPVPTVHRIMQSLAGHGYLLRARSRYRLGMSAVELGRRAIDSFDVRTAVRPVVRALAQATGETVLLVIHSETPAGALCIDRIEASHSLRLTLDVGNVTPLHAGASAKALLAFLPDAVIEEVLAGELVRRGPGTIMDPARLREALDEIHERGLSSRRGASRRRPCASPPRGSRRWCTSSSTPLPPPARCSSRTRGSVETQQLRGMRLQHELEVLVADSLVQERRDEHPEPLGMRRRRRLAEV